MSDTLTDPHDHLAVAALSPAARRLLSRALATVTAQAPELDTEAQHAMAELQALADTGRAAEPELEPIAYAVRITEAQLLGADQQERRRAAEWPWDIWCRICNIQVGSHRTEEFAWETADQHVAISHVTQAEAHAFLAAVAAGRIPAPEPVVARGRERWRTYWDRVSQQWRPVRRLRADADPAGEDANAGP
ncbi:hypothetical protein [Streptomyces sp. H39-S7]|uniref:hypothetical protein n=1 Tax=Streptomyces sp. H39-S7 TaxID=3004357 RepID=UPI0022B04AD2|nr:hypothetical protein [Streptomyces sp. H39-S7]MCZ4124968.1 hypothetical protein [Streptomyces sp. H39-S7]